MDREQFGWWLAGIADGESCFSIVNQRLRRGKHEYRSWYFRFTIALRADDLTVLKLIQSSIGGTICFTRDTGAAHPKANLQVVRQESLRGVVRLFREFPLQSKKAGDFKLWAEAFETWTGAPTFRKGQRWAGKPEEAHQKVRELHEQLKEYRQFFDVRGVA